MSGKNGWQRLQEYPAPHLKRLRCHRSAVHGICQLFSINELGGGLRQLTHLPSNLPSSARPAHGYDCYGNRGACVIDYLGIFPDQVTGTVLFSSSCDPTGGNPFGDQIFAIRLDGTGLRQLTATRGMTADPDGTLHVETPGPFAYPPTFR